MACPTSSSAADAPAARAIWVYPGGDEQRARALGRSLGLPLEPGRERGESPGLVVRVDALGVALQRLGAGAPGPVRPAPEDPAIHHRRRGHGNELLGRAVGLRAGRAPRVLDATAGLGRDSVVLADTGCTVLACERQPLLAALLGEALARARAGDGQDWLAAAARRITLRAIDAREVGAVPLASCDVIYLDPMYHAPRRRAAAGKELALLQWLHAGSDEDEAPGLLAWALRQQVRRVVLKRPRRAAVLRGRERHFCIEGRAVRFDVYLPGPGEGIP